MMARFAGWLLAGGIVLAAASTADAQVAISLGNPYGGNGVFVGNPGYSYGYPATTYYNSGYAGYAPVTAYSYPAYGYRTYGYRGYGYPAYGVGRGWNRGWGWAGPGWAGPGWGRRWR